MTNCTSPPESGCYFDTSQESLSTCWNAGGSVNRVLGCADGPKFLCIGNASAISSEATIANIQTQCVTKASNGSLSSHPGKSVMIGILAFVMFILASAGIASAQVNAPVVALLDGPTLSNLTTTTYGSQTTELASFLLGADAGDVLVLGNSGFTVVDAPAGGNLSSRDCVQMTYLQTNVDRTGTWWNSWYEVEGCHWCGKRGEWGGATCPFSKSISISQTWSFNAGFNAGGAQAAQDAINKNGALNLGFSWQKSKSETFQFGCTPVQGDVASIWSRNKMGWSDTAQRYCQYAGCGQQFSCGTWSFGHVDWALNGGAARETSCSYGDMAQCG